MRVQPLSADAQGKPWERGHLALDEGWKPSFPALFPGREGILPSEGWKPSFPAFVGMLRVEE